LVFKRKTDALTIPWGGFDLVYFYFTAPFDQFARKQFYRDFAHKISEMKQGAVAAFPCIVAHALPAFLVEQADCDIISIDFGEGWTMCMYIYTSRQGRVTKKCGSHALAVKLSPCLAALAGIFAFSGLLPLALSLLVDVGTVLNSILNCPLAAMTAGIPLVAAVERPQRRPTKPTFDLKSFYTHQTRQSLSGYFKALEALSDKRLYAQQLSQGVIYFPTNERYPETAGITPTKGEVLGGVGLEQLFSIAVACQAAKLYHFDKYPRVSSFIFPMLGLFFLAVSHRAEWLSLLLGIPLERAESDLLKDASLEQIWSVFSQKGFRQDEGYVKAIAHATGVIIASSSSGRYTVEEIAAETEWFLVTGARRLRQPLDQAENDITQFWSQARYLANEQNFRYVKALWQEGNVKGILADITNPQQLARAMLAIKTDGLPLGVFYASNVRYHRVNEVAHVVLGACPKQLVFSSANPAEGFNYQAIVRRQGILSCLSLALAPLVLLTGCASAVPALVLPEVVTSIFAHIADWFSLLTLVPPELSLCALPFVPFFCMVNSSASASREPKKGNGNIPATSYRMFGLEFRFRVDDQIGRGRDANFSNKERDVVLQAVISCVKEHEHLIVWDLSDLTNSNRRDYCAFEVKTAHPVPYTFRIYRELRELFYYLHCATDDDKEAPLKGGVWSIHIHCSDKRHIRGGDLVINDKQLGMLVKGFEAQIRAFAGLGYRLPRSSRNVLLSVSEYNGKEMGAGIHVQGSSVNLSRDLPTLELKMFSGDIPSTHGQGKLVDVKKIWLRMKLGFALLDACASKARNVSLVEIGLPAFAGEKPTKRQQERFIRLIFGHDTQAECFAREEFEKLEEAPSELELIMSRFSGAVPKGNVKNINDLERMLTAITDEQWMASGLEDEQRLVKDLLLDKKLLKALYERLGLAVVYDLHAHNGGYDRQMRAHLLKNGGEKLKLLVAGRQEADILPLFPAWMHGLLSNAIKGMVLFFAPLLLFTGCAPGVGVGVVTTHLSAWFAAFTAAVPWHAALASLAAIFAMCAVGGMDPLESVGAGRDAGKRPSGLQSLASENWYSRTAVLPTGNRRVLATKFKKRGEDLSLLEKEARAMRALRDIGINIPIPLKMRDGAYIFSYNAIPAYAPYEVDPAYKGFAYIAQPEFFIYPEDIHDVDTMRRCALNSIIQFAQMLNARFIHTSLSPLSHAQGLVNAWRWNHDPLGGIEDMEEAAAKSNIRLAGIADFAHVRKARRGESLYNETIQSLCEWVIVITYHSLKNGIAEEDTVSILRDGFNEFFRTRGFNDRIDYLGLSRLKEFVRLFHLEFKNQDIPFQNTPEAPVFDRLVLVVTSVVDKVSLVCRGTVLAEGMLPGDMHPKLITARGSFIASAVVFLAYHYFIASWGITILSVLTLAAAVKL
ncbi:MAG: hypothetical protein NTZ48_07645, partial [Candidatus Omnitrophica bacterium]|nr:hypothetical protein [Candidatus Omnitrophota bacterium]